MPKIIPSTKTLTDINECLENNGGCQVKCINTPGSHHCGCEEGYQLDISKTACEGALIEFELYFKRIHGDCIDSSNRIKCTIIKIIM